MRWTDKYLNFEEKLEIIEKLYEVYITGKAYITIIITDYV